MSQPKKIRSLKDLYGHIQMQVVGQLVSQMAQVKQRMSAIDTSKFKDAGVVTTEPPQITAGESILNRKSKNDSSH